MRSKSVSIPLTFENAVEIHRRRWCGDAQHVLAAVFSVNPGRISEVLSGKLFPGSKSVALDGALPKNSVAATRLAGAVRGP